MSKKTQRKRITFRLEAPQATEVILMGDFNEWNAEKHIMKRDEKGIWSKTVVVPPGRYEYKFLVDGQWQNDPSNQQTVRNRFGTLNNVVNI